MSSAARWAESGRPSLARALFAEDVDVAEIDPDDGPFALFAEEEAQIARAVDVRRREYGAARHLFRTLATGEHAACPLLNDAERAPIWPAGVVGSITHTRGYCAVVLGRAASLEALGVDAEPDAPLGRTMWRAVTTEGELRALEALEALDAARAAALARLVFSAKEAAYKAQYALTREFLGFTAMHVRVHDDDPRAPTGTFVATLTRAIGDRFHTGDELRGRFARGGGVLVTGVTLRRAGPALSIR